MTSLWINLEQPHLDSINSTEEMGEKFSSTIHEMKLPINHVIAPKNAPQNALGDTDRLAQSYVPVHVRYTRTSLVPPLATMLQVTKEPAGTLAEVHRPTGAASTS